jgi:N-acetylglucosamine-6-sulfatase
VSCIPLKKSDDSKPNIIVVLVDDMRWDEFSAAGHAYIKTPSIDRIAKEGAYFKNAFCTTPLCSPSGASFLKANTRIRTALPTTLSGMIAVIN